jgi:hypothetical protein
MFWLAVLFESSVVAVSVLDCIRVDVEQTPLSLKTFLLPFAVGGEGVPISNLDWLARTTIFVIFLSLYKIGLGW